MGESAHQSLALSVLVVFKVLLDTQGIQEAFFLFIAIYSKLLACIQRMPSLSVNALGGFKVDLVNIS